MSRFANLEFEREQPNEDQWQKGQSARDEKYYLGLADENFRTGKFEPALRYYSRALEFNVNVLDGWFGQIRMLIELGNYKDALLWADKALEIFRDQPDLLATKAVAYARQGVSVKALQFSDAAMQQRGTTAYAWLARGEALQGSRQNADEYCFSMAKALAGASDWFLLLTIARICYFYQAAAKALNYAQQAIALQPANAYVLCVLGDCQSAMSMSGAAEHSYTQALTLERDNQHAAEALAHLEKRGFFDSLTDAVWRLFQRRIG